MRDLSAGADWLVIFSTDVAGRDATTNAAAASAAIEAFLHHRVPYKLAVGKWQGDYENSFIVPLDAYPRIADVTATQDKVLVLMPSGRRGRIAFAANPDLSDMVSIGRFLPVSAHEAYEAEGATFDFTAEPSQWYSVKPAPEVHIVGAENMAGPADAIEAIRLNAAKGE